MKVGFFVDFPAQHKQMQEELSNALAGVFEDCRFILGPNVSAVESQIAELSGAKFAVGVNSGTDALLLSLAACEIGPGDEVITTPFSFVATVEVIKLLGANPVLADIDLDTFNLDPALTRGKITSRTKAIMPVHLFGQMADMSAFSEIAHDAGAALIADGAQAIGAALDGQPLAARGDLTTLSFYPTKNLGACGDGGMVLTNRADLHEKLRLLRFHGSGGGYLYKTVGYCSRLDEIQAAILLVKLQRLSEWNHSRVRNATRYNEMLADLDGQVRLPKVFAGNSHVYHQYTLRLTGKGKVRDRLRDYLGAQGIATMLYYPVSLHLQEPYRCLGHGPGDFPASEAACDQVLSLPIHQDLTTNEIDYVSDHVHRFFQSR